MRADEGGGRRGLQAVDRASQGVLAGGGIRCQIESGLRQRRAKTQHSLCDGSMATGETSQFSVGSLGREKVETGDSYFAYMQQC